MIKSLRVSGGVLWSVPLMNHYLLHSPQISHFLVGELKAAAVWKKKKKKRSTLPGQRTAEILTSQKRVVSPNDKLEMWLLGLHSVALWNSSSLLIPQAWTFIMESSKFSSTNQSPWEELMGPTLSFTNILWQVFLGHRKGVLQETREKTFKSKTSTVASWSVVQNQPCCPDSGDKNWFTPSKRCCTCGVGYMLL